MKLPFLRWRDQLALEPSHCRFGLHGITKPHGCFELMTTAVTFKGPKVITRRTLLDTSQEHFGLAF
jgi:hypothetical protein